uniref:hypothetical protein n=1 Tax=Staphylococcus epidermidis TaxID=1282 RepID=UPI00164248F2
LLKTVNCLLIFGCGVKERFGRNLIIGKIVMIGKRMMNGNRSVEFGKGGKNDPNGRGKIRGIVKGG